MKAFEAFTFNVSQKEEEEMDKALSYLTWSQLASIEKCIPDGDNVRWTWLSDSPQIEKWDEVVLNSFVFQGHIIGDWEWNFYDKPVKTILYDRSLIEINHKSEDEEYTAGYEKQSWWGVVHVKNTRTGVEFYVARIHNNNYWTYFGFSTKDFKLIFSFIKDLRDALLFFSGSEVYLEFYCGEDVYLPVNKKDNIILEHKLYDDIMLQVHNFYKNEHIYRKLDIPYKRGMLFTGSPGNGKTLMIRHIIKEAFKAYKVDATVIGVSGRRFSEDDLISALNSLRQRNKNAPGILVIEDMDTLVSETGLTRAGLLSVLDGIAPTEGVLIIGSTNNPELIDPALLHRPARFDRVFHFDLPNRELRRRYLKELMPDISEDIIEDVVKDTDKWSFAYMNELRICSSFIAIEKGIDKLDSESIMKAVGMLKDQFKTTADPSKLSSDKKPVRMGFSIQEDDI